MFLFLLFVYRFSIAHALKAYNSNWNICRPYRNYTLQSCPSTVKSEQLLFVRQCCLVDRCQRFVGTSCLHFQGGRVIERTCSLVDTVVSVESPIFHLLCRIVGTHRYLETIRGLFLQGRTVDVMPCSLLDVYHHGEIRCLL
jgi:hypothetical protein